MEINSGSADIDPHFTLGNFVAAKRFANAVAYVLAKLDFSMLYELHASLPPTIQHQYSQEQSWTAKYTRAFYYHVDPASETSRILVLLLDDSKSSDGRPGKKNARPSSTYKNQPWFLF